MGALFSYQNLVDQAALSAGSEANSMRSYNLADPIMQRRWRSLATTSFFLAQFQAGSDLAVLALAGATLGPSDQIRHRLYDSSGVVALDETVDAGVIDGYGVHFYRLATPQTDILKWRCDIVASSRSGEGWFDLGRAWAGQSFEPKVGISEGWTSGFVDEATLNRAKYSGVSFIGAGAQRRAMEFTLDYMDEDDRASCEDMMRLAGVRNQIFFAPFYDADPARQAILGRFISPALISETNNTQPSTYSQKFRIEQDK